MISLLPERVVRRIQDVILSFYLFNEFRGYVQLDRLVNTLQRLRPEESDFVSEIAKHAADERKHYVLFCQYFRHENRMPFKVGMETGYFDLLAKTFLGKGTDSLSEEAIARDNVTFARLCRTVVTTEKRGIKQIDALLASPWFTHHPHLRQIFMVIRKDEPSHFEPYEAWLKKNNQRPPGLWEGLWERVWHYAIALFVFPYYLLNPFAKRCEKFPDQTGLFEDIILSTESAAKVV